MNNWIHEYPRPQLKRNSFLSLNGVWQLNGRDIEVPFPPQSKRSLWKGEVPDNYPELQPRLCIAFCNWLPVLIFFVRACFERKNNNIYGDSIYEYR